MGREIRYCEITGQMIQPGLPYATNDEDVVWSLAAFNKADPAERERLGMRLVKPGQEARPPHSQIGLQAVPRTTPRHETPVRDAARPKTEQPAPADAGQAGVAPPKPDEETQDETDQAPKEQSTMTLLRNLALAGLGFAVIIYLGFMFFGVGDEGPEPDTAKSQQQPASAKAASQAQRERREAAAARLKAAEQARAAEEERKRREEAARQKPLKPSAGDSAPKQKAPETVDTADSQKAPDDAARPTVVLSSTPLKNGLLREHWKKIRGKEVRNLLDNPRYPDQPSGHGYISDFQAPPNWGDNYGARISGFLHPPVTGKYTFWIASNNGSELFLSTDYKPENKVRIASYYDSNSGKPNEWSKRKEQKSRAIVLEAGFSYYVEVLHKESSKEDHVSVGWQLPDGTMERPIPAKRLTPAAPRKAPDAIDAAAGPKPTWLPVGGKFGGALKFNGAGDHVLDQQGRKYLNGLKAITVSLWAKASAVGTDKGLLNGIKPDGEDEVLGLRYDKDGADGGGKSLIKAALRVTSGNMKLESSSNVQTTAWQHIALTWKDGAKLSLYINGELNKLAKVSSAGTGSTKGVTKLFIGKGSKDKDKEASSWDGLIDDVRIYSRALSAAEIKALSSIRIRRPSRSIDLSSGLVAHWKFDETKGNQASDASDNGHQGKLIAGKLSRKRTVATKALGIRWYQLALGPKMILGPYAKNFSGLTFNPETRTLFVVVDSPPMILELALDGTLKRSIRLRGFSDPEGIVHVSGETFYVVEEGRRKLCEVRIGEATKSVSYYSCRKFIIDSKPAGNFGLEGVAYDPQGNRFFIAKEKSPRKIYLATLPGAGLGRPAVQEPWNLEETPQLKDVSGLHYDPASKHLLVLSHESRCVIEYTTDGIEVGRLKFDISKAEGITMDHEGNIYICGEPNELYIFKK